MKSRNLLVFAAAFIFAALVGRATAQVVFEKPDFDFRSRPTLALDLNRDGITDFATAVDGAIIIRLNPGGGSIGSGTEFPAGQNPIVMIAGDFNGDRVADLAELSSDGTVTVLLGNGDGTFSSPMSTSTGATHIIASIAAADFNGDRLDDVAFTTGDGNVFVLLGNGDGTFNVSTFASGATGLRGLDAADFDGDGNVDLAVLTCCRDEFQTGDLQILPGHGDGTFGPLTEVGSVPGPIAITAAELNNDGHPDLLVSFAGCQTHCDGVETFINRGDGTFSSGQALRTDLEVASLPVVGDFNGDGIPDVAFNGEAAVHVFLGNGNGTFAPLVNYAKGPINGGPLMGDFTGDGVLDLAALNDNGTLTILTGNGDGTFLMSLRFRTGDSPIAVTSADFNGDGIPDLVVANTFDRTVSLLLGNGDGTFQPKTDFATGSSTPFALAAADFNGDGRPDLALTDFSQGSVVIMLNDGSGSLSPASTLTAGRLPSAVVIADFNGDGVADLAVTNQTDNTVSIFLGNGDGSFGAKTDFPAGPFPTNLVAADFNGDGIMDLAITDRFRGNGINILLGNGDGTFRAGNMLLTGDFPVSVTAGDFNGDGIMDLAWVVGGVATVTATVQVALGNGDGTFGAITTMPLGGVAGGVISSADINGDGVADLVVVAAGLTSDESGDAAVYVGNGDGTFQSPAIIPAGFFSTKGTVADFNGDGLPDIAVLTEGGFTFGLSAPTVAILLNRSH